MAETTKVAKAALASKDPAKSDEAMRKYASEAREAMALWTDESSKARDFRERFSKLAATAEGFSHSGSSSFKAVFGNVVDQCRSCHAVYK